MVKQLDLFSLDAIDKKDELYQKLEHYGIDEKVKKKFSGESPLLNTVQSFLDKQENYEEYYEEMIMELKKIVPVRTYEECISGEVDCSCLIETDYGYRHYTKYKNNGGTIATNGPLQYFGDLHDDFFSE